MLFSPTTGLCTLYLLHPLTYQWTVESEPYAVKYIVRQHMPYWYFSVSWRPLVPTCFHGWFNMLRLPSSGKNLPRFTCFFTKHFRMLLVSDFITVKLKMLHFPSLLLNLHHNINFSLSSFMCFTLYSASASLRSHSMRGFSSFCRKSPTGNRSWMQI